MAHLPSARSRCTVAPLHGVAARTVTGHRIPRHVRPLRFTRLATGRTLRAPLALVWEAVLAGELTDRCSVRGVSALELWQTWSAAAVAAGRGYTVPIGWYVVAEARVGVHHWAPFQFAACGGPDGDGEDFLTAFTWPEDEQGPVNLHALPVLRGGWAPGRDTRGGFVEELTGWRPGPLQPSVDLRTLALGAGGLPVPSPPETWTD